MQSDHCSSCKTKCKFECFSVCVYWVYASYPAKGMIFFLFFCHRCTGRNIHNILQREEEQSIEGCLCLSGMIFCCCQCVSYSSEFFLVYLECPLQLPLKLDMQKWTRISTGTPPWRYRSSFPLFGSLTKLFQSLSNVCLFFGFDFGEAFPSWC